MSKKKRDTIVLASLMIIFGLLFIITSSLQSKGEIAYIKVRNQILFAVEIETGIFTPSQTIVITATEEPTYTIDTITADGIDYRFTIGNGIVKYENTYYIMGGLGVVVIEYKDKKIRIKDENSPYNICSKQGFSDTNPIICLPNYVTIEFNNIDSDVII